MSTSFSASASQTPIHPSRPPYCSVPSPVLPAHTGSCSGLCRCLLRARHVGGAPSPLSGPSEGGSLSSPCGLEQAYVPPALGTARLQTYPPKPLQASIHQYPPTSVRDLGSSPVLWEHCAYVRACVRTRSAAAPCLGTHGPAQSCLEIHGTPSPGPATTARPPEASRAHHSPLSSSQRSLVAKGRSGANASGSAQSLPAHAPRGPQAPTRAASTEDVGLTHRGTVGPSP